MRIHGHTDIQTHRYSGTQGLRDSGTHGRVGFQERRSGVKKKKILFLILLVAASALYFLASSGIFAEEPAQSDMSGETQSLPSEEDDEQPRGFLGFINEYISLCENGGVICRAFGTVIPATVDEKTGAVVDIHPAIYVGTLLLCMTLSYVIGSVNFGIIVSKRLCNGDVREHGSGNSGMTNVLRVYGKKAALLTFLGDAGKAAICTEIALLLGGNGCGYLALAACMVGHAFPVFFNFKGGKSVACACGGMFILEPVVALIILALFIFIVVTTKYVSLGSIIGSAMLPVMINGAWQLDIGVHSVNSYDYPIVCFTAVFYACFIIWLHRSNIKRLYNKEERKISLSGKKKKSK